MFARSHRYPFLLPAALIVACCAAVSQGCSAWRDSRARVFRMGERVAVRTLIYNVLETEWKTQLGEGIESRQPVHRYLLVQVSVTNSGGTECSIPPMVLTDQKGQSYQEVMVGGAVPQWLGMLRKLGPAMTEQGRVVFDAPLASYRLRVASDDAPGDEQIAFIDLPLPIEPEAEPKVK